MGGACSKYGERHVQLLLGKPEGKKLLGTPRRRWEGIIKWFFKEWIGDVG
jgi:hypothetical protein